MPVRFSVWLATCGLALFLCGFVDSQSVSAPTVTLNVLEAGGTKTYSVPWTPGLSVLGVLEAGLPDVPNKGAFSLNYFPQYRGYFISAIGGEPAPGDSKYSRLCLTPAGSGSTTIVLPIAPNKVLVGKDDTVVLAFDQDCPGTSASHAP